jgi:hypothetical protein
MFSWGKHEGLCQWGEGVTRDIGVEGMFILTNTCPPLDATLQMEVCFQAIDHGTKLRLCASGRVLRLELQRGGVRGGFAASCRSFSLSNRERGNGLKMEGSGDTSPQA